jgi:hypothetical protein
VLVDGIPADEGAAPTDDGPTDDGPVDQPAVDGSVPGGEP